MQFPKSFRLSAYSVSSVVSSAVSVCSVCSVIALAGPTPARAQAERKLGTISFPTSGNAAAKAPFERGVRLYYSFEYGPAAEAFRDAQKADPSFALAYWGEALTYTHQVWNEQDLNAARTALNKLGATPAARRAKATTPREKMYMDLAEALYGDGAKARRDTLFAAAAERLSTANPTDDEAKVLHALGLLGLNQAVRDFTSYMKAGAIAEEVLRRNPDHPAAAHFVIHAFDDPTHAPLGLWAARAYSKIAPAAPHAQHMTSHIFVAMGMWDDVISQNVIASGHDHDAYRAGHYTWWLGYGYGQAGRYADARAHLETTRKNFSAPQRRGEGAALQMMRAHYVIDTERWTDAAATWDLSTIAPSPFGTANDLFLKGFGALKRGDREGGEAALAALAKMPRPAAGTPGEMGGATPILEAQLRGALLAAAGKWNEAVAAVKSAAASEDAIPAEFGPPMIAKPSHELLGEILLGAGKPAEAQIEFARALAAAPGRSRSLIGLARAASAAGDRSTVESAVATLRANWHAADNDLPELAELAKLTSPNR